MEIKNYFAQDAQGNIMPSANCYLYLPGTTTLATGLVDGNGAPISNPFLASNIGQVTFGAPNGVYDLRISQGARDTTIEIQCADLLQAMNETASFLGAHSAPPASGNSGEPLQIYYRYFNTVDQLEYLYKSTGWVANNLDGQLLATSQGASLIGAVMQDGSPGTVQDAIDIGDISLRSDLSSDAEGASLSAWKRKPLASGIKTVQGALDAQMVSVWESAFVALITVKPNPIDPSTWDWTPAFQAAVNALKGTGKKLYIPEGTYIVSTSGTVVSPPYLSHPYAIIVDATLEIVCHGKIMIPMDPDKKCIAFLFDGCTGGGLTGGFAEGYWSDIDALTTRLYNGAMAVVTRSSRVKVSGISTKNTGAGVIITSSVDCVAKDSISIRTDIRVKTGAQYGAYAGSLNLVDGCVVYGGTNDGDISLYGGGRGNKVVSSSAFNYFLGDPSRTVVNRTGQGICVDAGQVSASVRDSVAEGYYYGIDVKSGVIDCDIDRNRVRGNKVGIACRRGELDQQMTTCRVTRNNISPEKGNGSTSLIGGFSTIGLYVQDAFGVTADGNTIGVIPITGGSVENWIGVYASLTGAVGDNDNNFAITNNRFTFHDRLASTFAYNTGPLIKVIGDAASRLNFKFSGNTLKLREGASTVVQCDISSAGMVEIKDNPLSGPNSATQPFYSVSSSNTLQFNGNILRDCATVLLATDVRKVSIISNTLGGGLDSAVPHFKLIRPGSVLVNDNTKWTQTSPPFSDSKFLEVTEQAVENLMFSGNVIRATNQSATTYYSLNGTPGKTGANIVVSNVFMSL